MIDELLNSDGDKLRLFAVWCAKRVQHLVSDKRVLRALGVAERYAKGEATLKDLKIVYIGTLISNSRNQWKNYANEAVNNAAWPSSLNAAYYSSLNTCYAIASATTDNKTDNKTEYYAAAQKELKIHLSTFEMLGDLDSKVRLFSVLCVRKVQHLIKCSASLEALDVSERFAKGEASKEELEEARKNALAAKKDDSMVYGADIAALETTCYYSLEAARLASAYAAQAAALEVADYFSQRDKWWDVVQEEEISQELMLQKLLTEK